MGAQNSKKAETEICAASWNSQLLLLTAYNLEKEKKNGLLFQKTKMGLIYSKKENKLLWNSDIRSESQPIMWLPSQRRAVHKSCCCCNEVPHLVIGYVEKNAKKHLEKKWKKKYNLTQKQQNCQLHTRRCFTVSLGGARQLLPGKSMQHKLQYTSTVTLQASLERSRKKQLDVFHKI